MYNLEQLHDAIHSHEPLTVKDYSEANEIRNLTNLVGWKTPRMQVAIYKVKLPHLKGDGGPQYLAHKHKSTGDQIFAVGKNNPNMHEHDFLFYMDHIPQEYRKFAKVYAYEEIDIIDLVGV